MVVTFYTVDNQVKTMIKTQILEAIKQMPNSDPLNL